MSTVEAPETTVVTVTVHPPALDGLLRDALSCAARDDDDDGTPAHPHLAGVLLHSVAHPSRGDVLVASATDRYQMVQTYTQVAGRLPHRLWLTCVQVEQVLDAMSVPLRDNPDLWGPLACIEVDGATVTVRQEASGRGCASTQTRFAVDRGTGFPDIHALAEKARAGDTRGGEFALDLNRLSRMSDRASRFKPMRLRATGSDESPGPIEVSIGERYAGFLMPTRVGGEGNGTPPLWPIPGRPPEAVAERV